MDSQYTSFKPIRNEIEHGYSKNVHIIQDSQSLTLLERLGRPETTQPWINEYVTQVYQNLLNQVVAHEFSTKPVQSKTRMHDQTPKGVYEGLIVDPDQSVVTVNLARAGTLPSHVCYERLNFLLDPSKVRQDHIGIARQTAKDSTVTGSDVSGHKIGGKIDGSIVMFPDPMGATGSTICKVIDLYRQFGQAKKFVSIHCMITPEFISKVTSEHPDLVVYAARLDRGLSSEKALSSPPGTYKDEEKGLNEVQYIVPGAGGVGEILNNAFV